MKLSDLRLGAQWSDIRAADEARAKAAASRGGRARKRTLKAKRAAARAK